MRCPRNLLKERTHSRWSVWALSASWTTASCGATRAHGDIERKRAAGHWHIGSVWRCCARSRSSAETWSERERTKNQQWSIGRVFSDCSHTTQPSSSLTTQQAQGAASNTLAQREDAPALSGLSRQFQPLNLLDDTPWPL